MTNNTTLTTISKRARFIAFCVILLVVLLGVYLLSSTEPDIPVTKLESPQFVPTTAFTESDITVTETTVVTFGSDLQLLLPELMYSFGGGSVVRSRELSERLIAKYGLSSVSPGFWTSNAQDVVLSYSEYSNSLVLGMTPPTPSRQGISEVELINTLDRFMGELGLFTRGYIEVDKSSIKYYQDSGSHLTEVESKVARFASAELVSLVDNIPVALDGYSNQIGVVYITSDLALVSLELSNFVVVGQPYKATTMPQNPNELKQYVLDNISLIRVVSNDNPFVGGLNDKVVSLRIDGVTPEYRYISSLNQVLPFLEISGVIETQSAKTLTTLTLPL